VLVNTGIGIPSLGSRLVVDSMPHKQASRQSGNGSGILAIGRSVLNKNARLKARPNPLQEMDRQSARTNFQDD
jgi:hypothetical protein